MGLFDAFKKRPKRDVTIHAQMIEGTPEEIAEYQKAMAATEEPTASPINRSSGTRSDAFKKSSKVETLRPPAPCGFDFDRVLVDRESIADKETGEIEKEKIHVTLDGYNYFKVHADMNDVCLLADLSLPPSHGWKFFTKWESMMGTFDSPGETNDLKLSADLEIMPLTPKGAVKKFPIVANVVFDNFAENSSFICHLSYMEKGYIGKAQLIQWKDRNGIMYDIDIEKDHESYFVKDIKVCLPSDPDDPNSPMGGWVKVHPEK